MKHGRYAHGPSQKTISEKDDFLKELFYLEIWHICNCHKQS